MTSHRRLIAINGPPHCGADFVSDAMRSFIQINAPWMKPAVMKIEEPIRKGAHDMYCAFHSHEFYVTEGKHDADTSCGDFLGMTPNQTYLEMRKTLEDLHGPEAIGYTTRKRILRNSFSGVVVLADANRVADLVPSVGLIGDESTLVVELLKPRENDVYIGDSLKLIFPKVTIVRLPCNMKDRSERELMKVLAQGTVKRFLDIEEKENA